MTEDNVLKYSIPCHCRNCGWEGKLKFKKGEAFPEGDVKCPACECIEYSKWTGYYWVPKNAVVRKLK